jgi:hypothetical protein
VTLLAKMYAATAMLLLVCWVALIVTGDPAMGTASFVLAIVCAGLFNEQPERRKNGK